MHLFTCAQIWEARLFSHVVIEGGHMKYTKIRIMQIKVAFQ